MAKRGRPFEAGLSYFPLDVDILDDDRMIDLMEDYGCNGFTIYIAAISLVYKNGYYLELTVDKLSSKISRLIGGRWCRKEYVGKVIARCAELELFDSALLSQGILTSPAIQRRYRQVKARSKVDTSLYWLLDDPENENSGSEKNENSEALLSAPINQYNASINGINAAINGINAAIIPQKKIKENKSKNNIYIQTASERKEGFGEFQNVKLSQSEYDSLQSIADIGSRIRYLDEYIQRKPGYKSASHYVDLRDGGWVGKAVQPVAKKETSKKSFNTFNNFNQRTYDYDELLKKLRSG